MSNIFVSSRINSVSRCCNLLDASKQLRIHLQISTGQRFQKQKLLSRLSIANQLPKKSKTQQQRGSREPELQRIQATAVTKEAADKRKNPLAIRKEVSAVLAGKREPSAGGLKPREVANGRDRAGRQRGSTRFLGPRKRQQLFRQ